MKIVILGAAAGIGLAAVEEALGLGHSVTALSPNVSAMPDDQRLFKVKGSATSVADLQKAIAGTDAILVTVGTKKKKGTTLFSEIAKALIAATSEIDYRGPVLVVTGFGAGDSKPYLGFFMKNVIRLFLKDQYADKTVMEKLIMASPMNWEIVRPGMLGSEIGKKGYKVWTELKKGMKVGKINRVDVADYLVMEAAKRDNLLKKVTLT